MRRHTLVRKGVLGFALAGLLVIIAAAQAQDKDAAKDAAKAETGAAKDAAKAQKDEANDTRRGGREVIKHVKGNTKQAKKTYKPKICPFCVPSLPNKWGFSRQPNTSTSEQRVLSPAGFKEKIDHQRQFFT